MFRERCIEFLQYVANLLHFLVCCKCIVCPKKSQVIQNRPDIQVQAPPLIIPSDFEDSSIYNGSSIYGVPPVRTQLIAGKSANTSGVTISTKSLTVANNETYMHAVKVEFTCEIKGMVEVGGVPKEVKGMISIINKDEKLMNEEKPSIFAASQTPKEPAEPIYLEPIEDPEAKKVETGKEDEIYDELKVLPEQNNTCSLPPVQGSYDAGYGSCSSKDTMDYTETEIYTNRETISEHENISLASDWSDDEHEEEPVYGNSNMVLKNKLDTILRRQASNVISIKKEERFSKQSVSTHARVENVERNSSTSESTAHYTINKLEETTTEEDEEHIYEDIVVRCHIPVT